MSGYRATTWHAGQCDTRNGQGGKRPYCAIIAHYIGRPLLQWTHTVQGLLHIHLG